MPMKTSGNHEATPIVLIKPSIVVIVANNGYMGNIVKHASDAGGCCIHQDLPKIVAKNLFLKCHERKTYFHEK